MQTIVLGQPFLLSSLFVISGIQDCLFCRFGMSNESSLWKPGSLFLLHIRSCQALNFGGNQSSTVAWNLKSPQHAPRVFRALVGAIH